MGDPVVITGMGTLNPIGLNVVETWENAIAGVSGTGPITLFDASHLNVKIASEIKGFEPGEYFTSKQVRRRDRVQLLASAAATEAVHQSGFMETGFIPERVGVLVSSAIGGMISLESNMRRMILEGSSKISPFAIPTMMINGVASLIAIDHGFKGPCHSIVSACATGTDNIGYASMLLRMGIIDIAVAGAAEAPITEIGIAGFDRLGGASRRNDDYSMTPQPFDKNRDGLVIGEGAAILILERESDARARGAEILAVLSGYGSSVDSFHITAPLPTGEGGARAIINALDSARMNRSEVEYINAHGTATVLNDVSETRAIKTAFRDLAYNIPVSSTKSMSGHIMASAGALEAIFCIMTIRDNVIPPTIHYLTPDPECDLDYVPNQARQTTVRAAISNSFGFGGHNSVLAIRKY
jgi:beta-ketoacyl-acyl-carrier-protein synthase II